MQYTFSAHRCPSCPTYHVPLICESSNAWRESSGDSHKAQPVPACHLSGSQSQLYLTRLHHFRVFWLNACVIHHEEGEHVKVCEVSEPVWEWGWGFLITLWRLIIFRLQMRRWKCWFKDQYVDSWWKKSEWWLIYKSCVLSLKNTFSDVLKWWFLIHRPWCLMMLTFA